MILTRTVKAPDFTFGRLNIPEYGISYCSIEDGIHSVKIHGKTAIPAGKYQVIINFSNRFKKDMPLLLNVPGFEGIRIHCGNTAEDTEGCILLGTSYGKAMVLNSRLAFDSFFPKLQALLAKGDVFLEIQ